MTQPEGQPKLPTLLALSQRREFLEIGIYKRLRDKFAHNANTPLPSVRLYTKAEIAELNRRGAGLPDTGWFNYVDRTIGIVVDESESPKSGYIRTAGTAVHEGLHWLFNFSPAILGIDLSGLERQGMNIFRDGSNEQRAAVRDRFSLRYLRAMRKLMLEEYRHGVETGEILLPENACAAALRLTLLSHTVLMVKALAVLKAIHQGAPAKTIWQSLSADPLCVVPDHVRPYWNRAFSITLEIWREQNEWVRTDLLREFLSMFPKPEVPQDSPLNVGGEHRGEDSAQSLPPPGDDMSNHSRPSEPGARPDETSQSDPSEWPDLTLSQNDSPIDADSVEEEADVVGQETQELQSRSETLGGLLSGGIARYRRRIRPVDGADLLQKAAPFARILAQGMKVSLTPTRRSNGTRGRLDVRRIVAIPDCPDPFATKEIVTFSAAPGSFWGMMLDLSGSKLRRNRWYSTQITAAAFHLACQSLGLAHQVVTSISLEVVAGEEVAPHRAIHLLAGTKPASNWDGDNYRETIPIYLEAVMRRPEAIRGVLVETDGQPGDPEQVRELVDDGRKRGLIILGCGLDLGDGDARGMREIFGKDFLVLATRDSFPMELASTLTTLTMKYVRAK